MSESVVKPEVKESKPEAAPKLPMGIDPAAQFQAANFDGVRGNASGAESKAAPAHGGGANPEMPGSTPLAGHNQIDLAAVHGPVRPWAKAENPGGGKKSPPAQTMIREGIE